MGEKLLSHMTILVLGTTHFKVGEKESIKSQSMQDREMSPSGRRNFNRGLLTPQVRFPCPAWTLMIDSYILPNGATCEANISCKTYLGVHPFPELNSIYA